MYLYIVEFIWLFVCVRVKTFNSKFVRDVSLKFLFVLPLSDFDIEQYWPHLISWEWFPTLSFSWRDYVNWSSFLKYLLEFSGQPILDWRFLFQKFYVTVSISLKFIGVFRWCIYFCFKYFEVILFGVKIFRLLWIPAGLTLFHLCKVLVFLCLYIFSLV